MRMWRGGSCWVFFKGTVVRLLFIFIFFSISLCRRMHKVLWIVVLYLQFARVLRLWWFRVWWLAIVYALFDNCLFFNLIVFLLIFTILISFLISSFFATQVRFWRSLVVDLTWLDVTLLSGLNLAVLHRCVIKLWPLRSQCCSTIQAELRVLLIVSLAGLWFGVCLHYYSRKRVLDKWFLYWEAFVIKCNNLIQTYRYLFKPRSKFWLWGGYFGSTSKDSLELFL